MLAVLLAVLDDLLSALEYPGARPTRLAVDALEVSGSSGGSGGRAPVAASRPRRPRQRLYAGRSRTLVVYGRDVLSPPCAGCASTRPTDAADGAAGE